MTRTEAIELAKRWMSGQEVGCNTNFLSTNMAGAFLAEVGRTTLVQRYVDELAHDIAVVTQYRKARSSGGQHVGTGGRLGAAPPSTLVYLERLVADLRAALVKEQP